MASTSSASRRARSLKTSSMPYRPLRFHSSAGVMTGMSISWQPIASISSRTICSTLRCTRQPAGSHVHSPAPTWRTSPARTMSLCESASASAGACFSVGRTSWDWRVSPGPVLPELRSGYGVPVRMRRRSLVPIALLICALAPAAAHASATQLSIMQDDDQLVYRDDATRDKALRQMKELGVDAVRVTVLWRNVAARVTTSDARRKDLRSPRSYGVRTWNRYDNLVRSAQSLGLRVYFSVTGPAPDYAHGRAPAKERPVVRQAWEPNPQQFSKFVTALGRRYSGRYRDEDTGRGLLPRVDFWGLWNEPNQAGWLAPQYAFSRTARKVIPYSPVLYRKLFLRGRRALEGTGHGRDFILVGETAPLGSSAQGRRSPIRPAKFLRELLCVDAAGHSYTGRQARARDCGEFDSLGPIRASAWGHHPYTKDLPPTQKDRSRDSITMANLNDLGVLIDRYSKTGRIAEGLPIVSTEFGYETNPPDPFSGQPLDKQAEFLNEGDFMAAQNPRVLSQTQFILTDASPVRSARPGTKPYWFTYQSGLFFANGTPKPAAQAYELPLLAGQFGGGVAVWGQLRFRPNGITDQVQIEQQNADGTWSPIGDPIQVTNPMGYFQTVLPGGGPGFYRAHWTASDAPGDVVSRTVQVG